MRMFNSSRLAAIIIILAVCPAVIQPELGRANGSSTPKAEAIRIKDTDRPPRSSHFHTQGVDRAAERMFPNPGITPDDRGGPRAAVPIAAPQLKAADLEQPGRVTLTRDEYEQFKQLTKISRAAPLEVALVNIAVKGTSLAMYFLVWMLGLVIFRYVFNRWFDEDVYTQTWPSVAVVGTMIVCTAWVIVATVQ